MSCITALSRISRLTGQSPFWPRYLPVSSQYLPMLVFPVWCCRHAQPRPNFLHGAGDLNSGCHVAVQWLLPSEPCNWFLKRHHSLLHPGLSIMFHNGCHGVSLPVQIHTSYSSSIPSPALTRHTSALHLPTSSL